MGPGHRRVVDAVGRRPDRAGEGRVNGRLAVLNVVGLTAPMLDARMPRLAAFVRTCGRAARVRPAFPAVTCTAQATYLTGLDAGGHGIVGNGWFDRDLCEVHFWKQSERLVAGPKLWDRLRERSPGFTCAKLFWWYNMASGADWAITPRPLYPADGSKVFDIHTEPLSLRAAIKADLGDFPFPAFWGPLAGIGSSRWIAASARWIEQHHSPSLSLVYLPHLDYSLQRLGPADPATAADLAAIDSVAGDLIDFYRGRGVRVALLSEYGIEPVDRPIHLNRVLRRGGWLAVKDELGRETLEVFSSRAFAVADHQVAHVYVRDPSILDAVRAAIAAEPDVAEVLGADEQRARGLWHARSGDLLAVAAPGAWFTYYFWESDAKAPDYARTVDIHRKPGYDPVELFLDPALRFPKLAIGSRLLRRKLGMRALMDVIPLDASLVRGSHGRIPKDPDYWPVFALEGDPHPAERMRAEEVAGRILEMFPAPG
jgi:predicted AlkP superfamily pyrophosphatase or phosphodiesterase